MVATSSFLVRNPATPTSARTRRTCNCSGNLFYGQAATCSLKKRSKDNKWKNKGCVRIRDNTIYAAHTNRIVFNNSLNSKTIVA